MLVVCWSPKGGSGTSTVATALAIAARRARESKRIVVVDVGGDVPAILGMPEPPIGLSEWIAQPSSFTFVELIVDGPAGISLLPRGGSVLPEARSMSWSRLSPELEGLVADDTTVVVDAGRDLPPTALRACSMRSFVIVRQCYLSIRRARLSDWRSTGVIVLSEPERALTPSDIESVLGIPIAAVVPMRSDISRRIDAGIVAQRPPNPLIDALAPLVAGDRPR